MVSITSLSKVGENIAEK